MRSIVPWFLLFALAGPAVAAGAPVHPPAASTTARAKNGADDEAVYRCVALDGSVSIQTAPCPQGMSQRKIPFERAPEPPPSATPPAPPEPVPQIAGHPVAPVPVHGPGDPYPLWECMRPDGSTFESRNGVPERHWVPREEPASTPEDKSEAALNAKIAEHLQKGGHFVRPVEDTKVTDAAPAVDPNAPPPGAPPGQWVKDDCSQLEPAQACARYAARRNALRKQIYASKPSDRYRFAPEEQDLTSMLFAACGL